MPCFHPVLMWRAPNGRHFTSPPPGDSTPAQRPCGRCIGCKGDKAADWTLRCMHELQSHARSCFLTLTYAPDSLPSGGSLNRRDLVLFLKKLRRKTATKLRHFGCGEYGEKRGRPHYHLILFGWCPHDLVPLPPTGRGFDQFDSAFLRDLWGKGRIAVSPLGRNDGESVGRYVASYTLKRDYGQSGPTETVDELTGEVLLKAPEFVTMPTRPGLGASWFDDFSSDLVHGYVTDNGSKRRIPRFYRRRAERDNPQLAEALKLASEKFRSSIPYNAEEETQRRFNDREKIALYNLQQRLKT